LVEILDHLFGARLPWPAAEGHDDVAEFTLKRTAARKLHRTRRVAIHLEQIEPWRRQAGHVSGLGLVEEILVRLSRGTLLNEFGLRSRIKS